MRTGRAEEHRHVALVTSAPARVTEFDTGDAVSAFSLLRLSVQARLLMGAVAAALLWGAVCWALA
jgi:hypothetical protein